MAVQTRSIHDFPRPGRVPLALRAMVGLMVLTLLELIITILLGNAGGAGSVGRQAGYLLVFPLAAAAMRPLKHREQLLVVPWPLVVAFVGAGLFLILFNSKTSVGLIGGTVLFCIGHNGTKSSPSVRDPFSQVFLPPGVARLVNAEAQPAIVPCALDSFTPRASFDKRSSCPVRMATSQRPGQGRRSS